MRGLMMDYQLTLRHILERANRLFPAKHVVTRDRDGVCRGSYAELFGRVHRLAGALDALGVRRGDRVASLAWNHQRHLELYFAAPCMGAVLHTINFRLFADQIVYIANHAEDKVILIDPSVLPIYEPLADQLRTVEHVIVMGEPPSGLGSLGGPPVHRYEDLLAAAPAKYPFPDLDEGEAAAMCYTSATTGHPKGLVYSHRALVLHSIVEAMVDVVAVCERDVVMPVVPMFHVNSWGLPFTATMVGATQVLPNAAPTPTDLVRLIETQRVTLAAGVPTVWFGVLSVLQQGRHDISSLKRILCGGSAAPAALIQAYERLGVEMWHAWGMTEMSPLGTVTHLKSYLDDRPPDERAGYITSQGLPSAFVDMKVIDEQGQDVAWDGNAMGELVVRGPWVAASYYRDPTSADRFTDDGWFRTGDVATLDSEGYLHIADRTKDLIKSGGEWISSVDLENALMAHPCVAEAAVVAIADEKWGERPLACVVRRTDSEAVSRDDLLEFLRPRFASWWLPDDIVFIEELPKTGVGKFDKKVLREQFKDHARSSPS